MIRPANSDVVVESEYLLLAQLLAVHGSSIAPSSKLKTYYT